VSHQAAVELRGHTYESPVRKLPRYVDAIRDAAGDQPLPPIVAAALGPAMTNLAGGIGGAYTYFSPPEHTASAREIMGDNAFLAVSQMVIATNDLAHWRDEARPFLEFCLGMPNYVRNLQRCGFADDDLRKIADVVVDALVVPDDPALVASRLAAHFAAGADHVVVQVLPYSDPVDVLARLGRIGEMALAQQLGRHR
jgi:probable F420-dependent oxidoreductase